jgi:transmembrane sensor
MMRRPTVEEPIVDRVAEQAIEWIALLRSGEATETERGAFAAWRTANPRHEAACARLERSLGLFDVAAARSRSPAALREALLVLPARRKVLRGALAFAGLGVGTGLFANRVVPLLDVTADLHTATGERRTYTLADGSHVILNARSAADVAFDQRQRLIHLRHGELIATVARDPLRPFLVKTSDGTARALGTRFLVRQSADATRVVVLHSSVAIQNHAGARITVDAGSGTRFDARRVDPATSAPAAEAAWEEGVLEAHDRPLAEVVSALQPYRVGLIRVDPQAAVLRVSGVFPLDDTERALRALEQMLPLRVRRYTPYLVIVEPRSNPARRMH